MWRLHGAVPGHDVLFCVYYTWPMFVAEGAAGFPPGDFVMFLVHMPMYLSFICIVLLEARALPDFPVIFCMWFYAAIIYFHHHLC